MSDGPYTAMSDNGANHVCKNGTPFRLESSRASAECFASHLNIAFAAGRAAADKELVEALGGMIREFRKYASDNGPRECALDCALTALAAHRKAQP